MKYEMTGRIRYSEVDREKRITLPAIINYFQDCSIFQSEELKVGINHLAEHHEAWLLTSWQIVVERRPEMGEHITAATWAYKFQGIYGYRNFQLIGADGRPAAYANSIWVYMDMENGRPMKPGEKQIQLYDPEPALEMDYAPRKIKLPKESLDGQAFPVQKYHIDTNGHVNNCQYIQMAMEILPEDISVTQVRVEYRKAAVYGDIIVPKIAAEVNRTVVQLCAEHGEPFAVVALES